jgi:hypothetical protein
MPASLSPPSPLVGPGAVQTFTPSGFDVLGSILYWILTGGGSIARNGNNLDFTAPGSGTGTVKAKQIAWVDPYADWGAPNLAGDWVIAYSSGTPFRTADFRNTGTTAVGDGIKVKVGWQKGLHYFGTIGFYGDSIQNSIWCQDGQFHDQAAGTNSAAGVYVLGDIIEFRRKSGGAIECYVNGSLVFTSTTTFSGSTMTYRCYNGDNGAGNIAPNGTILYAPEYYGSGLGSNTSANSYKDATANWTVGTDTTPNITTTSLPGTTIGATYNQTLAETDGEPSLVWSILSGSLPTGLSLNSSTGVISGTVGGSAGTYSFTVKIEDESGGAGSESDTQALSIVVAAAPVITTTSLPDGAVSSSYSQTISKTGGTGSGVFSVQSGSLPAGLSLNSSTGVISGTPTTPGNYSFTIRYTDTVSVYDDQALTLFIDGTPTISTTSLPDGTEGVSYSQTIASSGGNTPIVYSVQSGALPGGLSLNSSTGAITGTPTIAGSFSFTIRATDNDGDFDDQAYSLDINALAPTPVSLVPAARHLLPFADLELWANLENAVDGSLVSDYSGNARDMACASSQPTLSTIAGINNQKALYFDGTKNPLNVTGSIPVKHIFIVCAVDGATFTGSNGLLSGIAAGSILRGNGATTTKFANLSYGAGFSYKKKDVSFAQSSQNAPMSGAWAVLEVILPDGSTFDGMQIGRDLAVSGSKFKGWVAELLVYSGEKNEHERLALYQYFAMKFFTFQETSGGLKIFPFATEWSRDLTEDKSLVTTRSVSGVVKQRAKITNLKKRFEAVYDAPRLVMEYEAARAFVQEHYGVKSFMYRDFNFDPNKDTEAIFLSEFGSKQAGYGNGAYSITVQEK